MNKQELLAEVADMAARNELGKEELLAAFEGAGPKPDTLKRHLKASDLLYYIGGVIVVIGISILVWQNWSYLNSAAKILVTLGFSMGMFVAGSLLVSQEKYEGVGQAFFVIATLLSPLGIGVTFEQAGISTDSPGVHSVMSLILLAAFLAAYYVYKRNLFLLFSIFFGTWLFFAFTEHLIGPNPMWDFKFTEYRFLLTGLSYMLLGYAFSENEKRVLTGVLYGFGSIALLGAAMSLQGWNSSANAFWEVIYPFITVGMILLSTRLRSRSFLVFGSLFLMGYILKITSEYFADTVGWPVALVIAGFGIIAVAYFSMHIKRLIPSKAAVVSR